MGQKRANKRFADKAYAVATEAGQQIEDRRAGNMWSDDFRLNFSVAPLQEKLVAQAAARRKRLARFLPVRSHPDLGR